MTIIKSIPLLYLCLSLSRYLSCIDAYHQVDTSAVFMTIIKSIPLLVLISLRWYHQYFIYVAVLPVKLYPLCLAISGNRIQLSGGRVRGYGV